MTPSGSDGSRSGSLPADANTGFFSLSCFRIDSGRFRAYTDDTSAGELSLVYPTAMVVCHRVHCRGGGVHCPRRRRYAGSSRILPRLTNRLCVVWVPIVVGLTIGWLLKRVEAQEREKAAQRLGKTREELLEEYGLQEDKGKGG